MHTRKVNRIVGHQLLEAFAAHVVRGGRFRRIFTPGDIREMSTDSRPVVQVTRAARLGKTNRQSASEIIMDVPKSPTCVPHDMHACYTSAIMHNHKTSRRAFLGGTTGAAAFAIQPASAQKPAPAQAKPGLALEDFEPKSMLVVPHHPTPRSKYPVIDVHTHVSSVFPRRRAAGSPEMAKAFRQIDAIAGWMETLNIRTMLNLTGGYGDLLKQNISDLQDRYKALQHSRKLRQSIQESKLHMEGPFRLESALEILF